MTNRNLAYGIGGVKPDPHVVAAFLERLNVLVERGKNDPDDVLVTFRGRLRDTYGSGFDAMAQVHETAVEAAAWGADSMSELISEAYADKDSDKEETRALEDYDWIMRGLTARGALAFAEVTWLLEGGFPQGATARVRTLHEIAITASIIAIHGNPDGSHPELVERFARHHEVFNVATAKQLTDTGALSDGFFDEEAMELLREKRRALLAEFGSKFGESYGWAQPLFGASEKVSFSKLSSLVEPSVSYLYRMASSHVHADSEGWQHSLVDRGGKSVFAAGPTNFGLALPASLACQLLLVVLEFAVPTSITIGGEEKTDGALLLRGVKNLAEKAMTLIEAGESEVEERERRFQAGGDGARPRP